MRVSGLGEPTVWGLESLLGCKPSKSISCVAYLVLFTELFVSTLCE